MDKKDPISFQSRKRQHTAKKPAGKAKPGHPPRKPQTGDTDEVREYWTRFFHHPLSGPARYAWTERMLWGNALLAAILTTLGIAIESGFSFLTIISVFINTFFLFFLFYYLFPWVADWVFRRLKVRSSTVDGIKLEIIVVSGWLVIVSLIQLIPVPLIIPYWLALLAFGVLLLSALHRRVRSSWPQALLATLGGTLSVIIVNIILHYV